MRIRRRTLQAGRWQAQAVGCSRQGRV